VSLLKRIEQGQSQTPQTDDLSASRLAELRSRRPSGQASAQTGSRDAYFDLKTRVQNKLLGELDPSMDVNRTAEVRRTIEDLFETILAEESIALSRAEKKRLFEAIVAEILGFGPLEPLLADEGVTEIMVNGCKNVYIERKGKVERVPVSFESDDHVMRIIDRIVSPLGRRIDESSPYVDARLPDGSRVNAVIPPISLVGPILTTEAIEFLKACVVSRLNVVISGGTGSGKTTLLNILSQFIPADERIITIENAAELQLRQEHVVSLESRPPNIEGRGEVTIRDLVINALRMRPERIVVGEVRDDAALDMLQAMNTGHDGSMTTLHSNSPRDTLSRLETMVMMAGMDLPSRAIREQIASAINLIVHQERLRDGSRHVTYITEVQGMEGDVITMTDLFVFEQTGIESGRVVGRLRPTGLRPKFMDRIEASGIHLPASVFGIGERVRY
jgi:pilus assembly protein CpaF